MIKEREYFKSKSEPFPFDKSGDNYIVLFLDIFNDVASFSYVGGKEKSKQAFETKVNRLKDFLNKKSMFTDDVNAERAMHAKNLLKEYILVKVSNEKIWNRIVHCSSLSINELKENINKNNVEVIDEGENYIN